MQPQTVPSPYRCRGQDYIKGGKTMNEFFYYLRDYIIYFWDNDPVVESTQDKEQLWKAFLLWCIPNLKDIFPNMSNSIILSEVEANYYLWESYAKN
jgi:hypothetical protein